MIATALECLGLKTKQPEAPPPEPVRKVTVRGQEYTADELEAHLRELCQGWGELTGVRDNQGHPVFGQHYLPLSTKTDDMWNFHIGIVHPVLGLVTTSLSLKNVGELQQLIGRYFYEMGANGEAMAARALEKR